MYQLVVLVLLMSSVFPAVAQDFLGDTFTVTFDEINTLAQTRGFHLAGFQPESGTDYKACFVEHHELENGITCFLDIEWDVLEVFDDPVHAYTLRVDSYWGMMEILSEANERITSELRPYFDLNSVCTDIGYNQGCVYTSLIIPSLREPYCVGKLTADVVSRNQPNYEQYYLLEPQLTAQYRFEVGEGTTMALAGDYLKVIPIETTNEAIGVILYVPQPIEVNSWFPMHSEQFVINLDLVEMIHCPPNHRTVALDT